ncbi:hypothetical protein Aph02nite_44530 [Actinoplanes philippinensis]|uniref:Uncharacterized protein n=1 Tax=Actinoplanes philippinensis TaxID=35752 RepID=A0A1I2I8B2_9ACTN|nr:hypothetical protein [Actinoplanes philippinensis]GIE78503.1 hypothetical protein Aph02nite_44530 [Actinoplanes philippinensis]SFF38505.1 hypothetical protein SAMN05421541_109424 [Actinoplanes philippinensis]
MRAPGIAVALAAGLSVAACAWAAGEPATGPVPSAAALPAGWRWESYGGIEVGVPADFGYDNGSQRLGQWCVGPRPKDADSPPVVGRPGISTAAGCMESVDVADTGPVVSLGPELGEPADGVTRRGDRTTVRLHGVAVIVQVGADLREQIVGTVRVVEGADHQGCLVRHPITDNPAYRPVRAPAEGAVTSVSACRYSLLGSKSIISSLRLDGAAAQRSLDAVRAEPVGGGPDEPRTCTPDVSYGDEVVVLLAGGGEVVVRYSGCDHRGFDDGRTVRRLGVATAKLFLTGANTVFAGAGPALLPGE